MRFGAIQVSAALAALVLSAGLVLRISTTLTAVSPETRSDTAARAAIQIRDNLGGVAMFENVDLAPGTAAEPIDAKVAVAIMPNWAPKLKSIPNACAIKIAATA